MGLMAFIGPWLLIKCAFAGSWLFIAFYIVWYYYDTKSPERGGYPSDLIRSAWLPYHQGFRDYFPITLHKTADLDPEKNYLFVYHPHGVSCLSTYAHFATKTTGFTEKFPGIQVSVCGLHINFKVPFRRELLMLYGYISCSKESLRHVLTKMGKGRAAVLIVGGAEESLEAHPKRSVLTLAKRQGFAREALITGAYLVPVYSFGENDIFYQAQNPPGSFIRSIQTWAKKTLGFTFPVIYGRGFLTEPWGIVPLQVPIDTVIGAPIPVKQIDNPSKEDVDLLHKKYIEELKKLFDTHKTKYGIPMNQPLVLQ